MWYLQNAEIMITSKFDDIFSFFFIYTSYFFNSQAQQDIDCDFDDVSGL